MATATAQKTEPSYQKYIKYFGSPEAYAEAIKAKIASGQPFSDFPAAQEFMKDYQQYFKDTEKLVPVRSTFEEKGYRVTYNPDTGTVTVGHSDNPYLYKATVKPSGIAGGTAYVPESKVQAIEERVTPPYQKTYTELTSMAQDFLANMNNIASTYLNTINNYVKQYGDAGLAMLQAYQQQYSQALAQLQQLMQPRSDVPESVKLAIQLLKEQTDENLKALDEEMIRRGIYRSGIAADMRQKLYKGQLEEEQKLLAQWLDQQHQQMYNAALEYARMQANYASGLANLYQAAVMKPIELGMGAAQTAYQIQSGLAEKAFDIAKSLKTWLAERQQAAQQSALQYETELAKQQFDIQKWLAEQALKEKEFGLKERETAAKELATQSLVEYRKAQTAQKWKDLELKAAAQQLKAQTAQEKAAKDAGTERVIASVNTAKTFNEAVDILTGWTNAILSGESAITFDIGRVMDFIRKRWPNEAAMATNQGQQIPGQSASSGSSGGGGAGFFSKAREWLGLPTG